MLYKRYTFRDKIHEKCVVLSKFVLLEYSVDDKDLPLWLNVFKKFRSVRRKSQVRVFVPYTEDYLTDQEYKT